MPEAERLRPNILIVLPDQLRASALACMGNDLVRTPNIDRLAARGLRFTNATACTPVCSPCRAQILTGRFSGPSAHPLVQVDLMHKLAFQQTTLAEVLKGQGYATGYIGKWHLSPRSQVRSDGFVPPGEARQGFDYWAAVELPTGHYDTIYYRDTPDPIRAEGFACDVETDLAIRYVKTRRKEPFFLMVSWNPPHGPYKPPQEYDIYDPEMVPLRPNVPRELAERARKRIARYYGLVSAVDFNLGRILQALDESGQAENTIVFFCSDHGVMHFSQGVRQGQGEKQRPWRESRHVPFILSYPPSVTRGRTHDVLIGSVDVMPTLLGLAGVAVPDSIQGRDLSPLILGRPYAEPESTFLHISKVNKDTPLAAPWRGVLTKEWLFTISGGIEGGDWLLYNVREDPFEVNNLVHDPGHRAKKEELRALLEEWRQRVGDDLDLDLGQFFA